MLKHFNTTLQMLHKTSIHNYVCVWCNCITTSSQCWAAGAGLPRASEKRDRLPNTVSSTI